MPSGRAYILLETVNEAERVFCSIDAALTF
jgi:hypothetical protein